MRGCSDSWIDAVAVLSVSDPEAKSNVLIAYDDAPAGQRAMNILDNVDHRLDEPMNWYPLLWRFDLLEDPEWRVLATADALRADLLIIAASSQSDLPASVQDWIKDCLTQKHGTAAAVVALLGSAENLDEPDSPRIQFIKSAAARAGLDFFAPGVR